jgi:Caspase domain
MYSTKCSLKNSPFGLALAALFLAIGVARADGEHPNCYVLAVGVDRYASDHVPDLQGCANDARSLTKRIARQQGKLFGKVESRMLLDDQATGARITEGMQWLKETGKAGDFVVVIASGHGNGKVGTWDFLPSDFDPDQGRATALSGRRLLDLANAQAEQGKKALIIIDACFAGALRVEAKSYLNRTYPQGGGIVLMTSSMPNQTSAALQTYSAFAEAVGQGLEGKADLNGDGHITLGELRRYAYQRVYELLQQHGREQRQDGECDWSLSISEGLILGKVAASASNTEVGHR